MTSIGLHDVQGPSPNPLPKALMAKLVFPGGQSDLDRIAQRNEAVDLFRSERLLKPNNVLFGQELGHLLRLDQIVTHGTVDHQVIVRSNRLTHRGHSGPVVVRSPPPAHLNPEKSLFHVSRRFRRQLLRFAPQQIAGVGWTLTPRTPSSS